MPRGESSDADGHETAVLESIRECDENQWNNLVTHADRGTLFHRYEWLAAVEDGFDREARHVVVRKDSNPVACMPNFVSELSAPNDAAAALVSALGVSVLESGGIGHGGPVVAGDERANVERIFDALEAAGGRRPLYHLVSTADLGQIRYGQFLRARGYEANSNVATFRLDLCGEWEEILAGMDKSRRKGVRRAHEQDHDVDAAPFGEDLVRTYDMYEKNTERVGGNVLPFSFFRALREHLPDRARVLTARVDGETVGRYVYLLDAERSVLYHWLSAVPDRDCYDAYPSELMHVRAIKWGIEEGYDEYSFGETGSAFDNSVFRFKSQYGARAVPVLRWERGENRLAWPLFKLARRKYVERNL